MNRGALRLLTALALCGVIMGSNAGAAGMSRARATQPTAHASASLAVAASPARAAWDTLARLDFTRQWAASESLATLIIADLERQPVMDSLGLSHALFYVASSRLRRRLFADGRGFEALERSIGIGTRHAPPGDLPLIRTHGLGAILYTEAGFPERARDHAMIGIRLIEASSPIETSLLAQAKQSLAVALAAMGRMPEARTAFDEALRLREGQYGPDHPSLVPTLAEYGAFLARIGEFDAARELLDRAVHNSMRDTDPGGGLLEGSLGRLSTLERRVGNLGESVDLAERAYELARDRVGETGLAAVRARTVLAYRLQEFGDLPAAAAHLEAIVPLMEKALGASNPQTLNARLALVDVLVAAGDTTGAARELEKLRPVVTGGQLFANDNIAYFRELVGNLESARGHDTWARETLDVAIDIERSKHDALGSSLAELYTSWFATLSGPPDRALADRSGQAIDRLRDSTRVRSTPEWITLVSARANAEARVGLRDSAWVHALQAEQLAHDRLEYQLHVLPDERALQLAQQLGSPCDALVRLARADHEAELATAWDRIVRWRGLVRHEIARRRPPAAAGTDTATTRANARWLAAQKRLAQLVVSGAAHPDDPATSASFAAARGEAEDAERRYVTAASGQVAPDQPATLEHVLARLAPGQALVAFASASIGPNDRALGAFVATGSDRRPRYVELGPSGEIVNEMRAWASRLATPPADAREARAAERECRRLGARVRARVWDPVAKLIGDARGVLLVPEGALAELPWMALPGQGESYLAESPLEIRVMNAERDLLQATESARGNGLLAVGGPDFDRAGEAPAASRPVAALYRARTWPCGGREAISLAALPAARAEAEEIAQRWPSDAGRARLLVGAEATESEFKLDAPGQAVLHLATHGVVVDDSCGVRAAPALAAGTSEPSRGVGGVQPIARAKAKRKTDAAPAIRPQPQRPWLARRVWLALAGANRPPSQARGENEGLLTAEEIVTLDLRGTDWVVLSACQSGVARAWEREGVLGMRRAFHLAGARSVIASQWPIADQATREWMTALYAARARGEPAGPAVRDACRAMLATRRHNGRPTHPFYWAAFTASEE